MSQQPDHVVVYQRTGVQPSQNQPPPQPPQPQPKQTGFGYDYTGKEIARWAMYGHPEYAGKYAVPVVPEGYMPLGASAPDQSGNVMVSFAPKPMVPKTGFGESYTGKDIAMWAAYGHPEYAGVYETPTHGPSGFGYSYTGKDIAGWAALGSDYSKYVGKYAPPKIPQGYKVSSITETDKGLSVVYEPTMQTILHARSRGETGGPLQMIGGAVIPKGVNVVVGKQGEYVVGSNPLVDLISASGKAVGSYMNPKIGFSTEEARALGSGDASKVLAVETPKLERQAEVLGGVGLALIAPGVVIPGALASLGISEVASEVISGKALTPEQGAQALLVGGLFSAGAAGVTSVVSSTAARAALISGMGGGFGYVTGGPRGALLGAGLAGGSYLAFTGLSSVIGSRATDWLTSKAIERGPLESASLSERFVSLVTGAKPQLSYGTVDVPQAELATMETHGLPKLDLTKAPDLGGYDVSTASEAVRMAGKEPVGQAQDLAGFGISEKEFAALSLEDQSAYRAFAVKDVPVERMPSDFLSGKLVKTLDFSQPAPLNMIAEDYFDVSVAPRTSGLLMSKMPADTLAKEWAMEKLYHTAYGGIAYSSVKEALASDTSKAPYVPDVGSSEELSRMAFTPFLSFNVGQVQQQLPKIKPATERTMPYIPKVDVLQRQKQNERALIATFPLGDTATLLDLESSTVTEQAQKQESMVTQVPVSLQEQVQVARLDVSMWPEQVRASPFVPGTSGFDWPRRTRKVQFERRGFTSVFRGWPVRRPSEVLKMGTGNRTIGFNMPKPSSKKLKSLISEEKRSSNMYRGFGFPKIAKQETSHRRTLEQELKRRQKKR